MACRGKWYALNAPLESGITDDAYRRLFQPVMRKAVEVFQPEAIVFQSGVPLPQGMYIQHLYFLSVFGDAAVHWLAWVHTQATGRSGACCACCWLELACALHVRAALMQGHGGLWCLLMPQFQHMCDKTAAGGCRR